MRYEFLQDNSLIKDMIKNKVAQLPNSSIEFQIISWLSERDAHCFLSAIIRAVVKQFKLKDELIDTSLDLIEKRLETESLIKLFSVKNQIGVRLKDLNRRGNTLCDIFNVERNHEFTDLDLSRLILEQNEEGMNMFYRMACFTSLYEELYSLLDVPIEQNIPFLAMASSYVLGDRNYGYVYEGLIHSLRYFYLSEELKPLSARAETVDAKIAEFKKRMFNNLISETNSGSNFGIIKK